MQSATMHNVLNQQILCLIQVDTTGLALVGSQAIPAGQTHQIPGTCLVHTGHHLHRPALVSQL